MKIQNPNYIKLFLTISIIIILILSFFIFQTNYQNKKQTRELQIYQQGLQQGFEQAIVQLIFESRSCQPVPVFAGNVTANLIDVGCLKQSQPNS